MMRYKTWTLTDVVNDVWLDTFSVGNDNLRWPTPHEWAIRKRTLRGGLRDGIDLVEIHNGAFAFSILPTRGMSLWRGNYHGLPLGWSAPLHGPVHPHNVNVTERGGLGWLHGFDEWLVRCGLSSNGPPGNDAGTPLTLHGRIANLPAHLVEVRINLDPPHELSVTGQVDESCLFLSNLRLTTTYTTIPGSNRIVIHDVIENRATHPADMQLLYHCNFGPPFLEAGSRIVAPIKEMSPQTPRAAEGIATYETYAGPTPGFTEQVYLYELVPDHHGRTLALLATRSGERGVCVRFDLTSLPCFTVWRNSLPSEEGYVTGLEPATNFPNFKSFEREKGRVKVLPAGGRWETNWSIEVLDTTDGVGGVLREIATLQSHAPATIHRTPQVRFTPHGS